jgi:sulfur-oxidizing protein SoxY
VTKASTRRGFMLGAGAAVVTLHALPALATPESMKAAIRTAFGDAPIEEGSVSVTLPPISENGNSVGLSVEVDCAMTEADHVRSIHVFSEQNPLPDVARYYLNARSGRARVTTRIRLADSQAIVAVATMSDGTLWSGSAKSIVALAACVDLI